MSGMTNFSGLSSTGNAAASVVWTEIAAAAIQTQTVNVSGAAVGNAVIASPNGALGTVVTAEPAYVSSAGVVTITLRNPNTITAMTPTTRTWRVMTFGA